MSSFMGVGAGVLKVISAKTAAYQIKEIDLGKIFTNRGAGGSVTFTLPKTTTLPAGWNCRFFGVADQNIVIASYGSSDDIVTHNEAGADTLTFSTAGDLIGVGVEMVWDGTSWLTFFNFNDGVTVTIA